MMDPGGIMPVQIQVRHRATRLRNLTVQQPIAETMRGLESLVRDGATRYIGQ